MSAYGAVSTCVRDWPEVGHQTLNDMVTRNSEHTTAFPGMANRVAAAQRSGGIEGARQDSRGGVLKN